MTFHLPSVICDRRDALLPSRFVGEKVAGAEPNMSLGMLSVSFALAASKAGANLSTDTFIKAMDTLSIPSDMFGSDPATFSPTKRLGSNASRLSQITDGKWKVISDYVKVD